jgi:hypothetical protein
MKKAFLVTVAFLALVESSASAALYERVGLSASDEREYHKIAASIPSCSKADALVPDIEHPSVGPHNSRIQKVVDAANLDQRCHADLKKRGAPLNVIRMTDYRRGMICLAIDLATPDQHLADQACNSPSAL